MLLTGTSPPTEAIELEKGNIKALSRAESGSRQVCCSRNQGNI